MKVYCAICFDTTTINEMCTHTTACKLLKEDDEHPSKDIEDVTFKRDAQVCAPRQRLRADLHRTALGVTRPTASCSASNMHTAGLSATNHERCT